MSIVTIHLSKMSYLFFQNTLAAISLAHSLQINRRRLASKKPLSVYISTSSSYDSWNTDYTI